jgi:hypothetical protein
MPLRSNVQEAEFAILMAQVGLDLSEAKLAELLPIYRQVQKMAEIVRKAREIDAEPATVFLAVKSQPRAV